MPIGPSERDWAISSDEVTEAEHGSEGVKCYKNVPNKQDL